MKKQYISIDGKYVLKDEYIFNTKNRAFKYGDAIFETMFASYNKVHFFYDHIERLINSMKILKMEIPVKLTVDTIGFHNEIKKILNINKLYIGARVRITVFRKTGGLYSPENNEISYIIETQKIDNSKYNLNPQGLKIDIYEEILKPINILSNLKTTNTLLYILAGIKKQQLDLDDMLILNSKTNIIESISANIFLVQNKVIYTPPLSDGCINGILRKNIIKIVEKVGISINIKPIILEALSNADEIFLTNAVNGIIWVGAFRTRRYYNKISLKLVTELNKLIN